MKDLKVECILEFLTFFINKVKLRIMEFKLLSYKYSII